MATHRTSPEATPVLRLLRDYSFDVETHETEALVTDWLQRFEPTWVSQAITEALYQGRYKVVSVDHILQIWQRRGQPLRHFNREFESIILGQSLSQLPSAAKVSPAPLNFSQETSGWPQPEAPATTTNQDHRPDALNGALPTPDSTPGSSSRTIPPLTPDQLARLAEPMSVPMPWEVAPPSIDLGQPSPLRVGTSPLGGVEPDPWDNDSTASDVPAPTPAHRDWTELDSPTPTLTSPEAGAESETPATATSVPIPTFQPIAVAVTPPIPADTIPTFVPAPGPSDLHHRLRAVVKAGRTDP